VIVPDGAVPLLDGWESHEYHGSDTLACGGQDTGDGMNVYATGLRKGGARHTE